MALQHFPGPDFAVTVGLPIRNVISTSLHYVASFELRSGRWVTPLLTPVRVMYSTPPAVSP